MGKGAHLKVLPGSLGVSVPRQAALLSWEIWICTHRQREASVGQVAQALGVFAVLWWLLVKPELHRAICTLLPITSTLGGTLGYLPLGNALGDALSKISVCQRDGAL